MTLRNVEGRNAAVGKLMADSQFRELLRLNEARESRVTVAVDVEDLFCDLLESLAGLDEVNVLVFEGLTLLGVMHVGSYEIELDEPVQDVAVGTTVGMVVSTTQTFGRMVIQSVDRSVDSHLVPMEA